jgi:cation/acetate symporter
MFWRGFSTAGAVASMVVGTVSAVLLIYLSPTVQVDVMQREAAVFPLRNPGLITVPLSFLTGFVASVVWPDAEAARRFTEVEHRALMGLTTAEEVRRT